MTDPDLRVEAFEQFFLNEHTKLVALGLAWTGDRQIALDLAQESLTRAYQSWDRVANLDAPGAWVRRVLINLLTDHQRSLRRRSRFPLSETALVEPDHAAVGVGPWWDAVRKLPDRQRAAVVLHYLEDMSVAQVAQVLDVAEGTVKASLSQGRENLRAALLNMEDV